MMNEQELHVLMEVQYLKGRLDELEFKAKPHVFNLHKLRKLDQRIDKYYKKLKSTSELAYHLHIVEKTSIRASKVKSQAAKDRKYATRDEVLKYFNKQNIKEVNKVFQLYNLLVDAKLIVIDKLNYSDGLRTLLKTKDGFEVTGQEGFVAIDHVGRNALKLVDRLNFSKANFSTEYIKRWQK